MMFKFKHLFTTILIGHICGISIVQSVDVIRTDYFVKLGNPWSVDCYTPFNKMADWYFVSADLKYNYYLFHSEKFVDTMITKYSITTSCDRHTYTLTVNQTTKDHAGYYGCWPDATTLDGRQYYKLISIEYTNIQLLPNTNKSTTLNMNISYMGHETATPTLKCTFPYGEKVMDERKCNVIKHDYSSCGLEKLFEPDDDAPLRCGIYFKYKLWKAEELVINPETEIIFIKKEASWNMSCNTASSYPMKWIFQSFATPNMNKILYSKWVQSENFLGRYVFDNSIDKKTFNMKIPRVDLNHSGTYMCTHKSTDHLVERRVDLLVIDELFIKFYKDPTVLNILISYIGNNQSFPSFTCDFNNEETIMNNMECKIIERNLARCQLIEMYKVPEMTPNKCHIKYNDVQILSETNSFFLNSTVINSVNVASYVLFSLLISIFLITVTCLIWRKAFMRKMQLRKKVAGAQGLLQSEISCLDKSISIEMDCLTEAKNIEFGKDNYHCVKCDKKLTVEDIYSVIKEDKNLFKLIHKNKPVNINCANCQPRLNNIQNHSQAMHLKERNFKLYDNYINKYKKDKGMNLELKIKTSDGNQSVKVHKILCSNRCLFIKKNIDEMPFNENPSIDLTNLNGDIVLMIIEWVYKDEIELKEDYVNDILKTAKYLKIYKIVRLCIDYICDHLNYFNCALTYAEHASNKDFNFNRRISDYIVANFYPLMMDNYLITLGPTDIVTFASDDNLTYILNNVKKLVLSDQEYKLFEVVKDYLNATKGQDLWPEFFKKSIRLGFLADDQLRSLFEDQSWLGTCKNKNECLNLINSCLKRDKTAEINKKYSFWNKPRNFMQGFEYDWSEMIVASIFTEFLTFFNDAEKEFDVDHKTLSIVKGIKLWYETKNVETWIGGIEMSYNSGRKYRHVARSKFNSQASAVIELKENEYINEISYECEGFICGLTFHTNLGKVFGPYGGNGFKKGKVKPSRPGGFLAGIQAEHTKEPDSPQDDGKPIYNLIACVKFCWGYVAKS